MNDLLGINNPFIRQLPETINIDNDLLKARSPRVIHHMYNLGNINGVYINTKKSPEFYRKYAEYNFKWLADNQEDNQSIIFEDTKYYSMIRGSGKGQRVTNHVNYMRIDPKKALTGAQATGDCVSWAIRSALDMLRCNVIGGGKWEAYIERQATCGIYSGRGHTGQGADPIELSAWAVKIGTILEKIYETSAGRYDFTDYDTYVRWGMTRGNVGVPKDLLEQTQPYTAASYKVVTTTDALMDLLFSGGSAHCGSDLGVSSYGDPVSSRQGSWSHDMAIVGYDDTDECKSRFGGRVWLWDQSWGNWNTVTNIPDWWKPWAQGMFVLNDKDTQWAINDGGTVVFFPGKWFPAEPISNLLI